MFIVRTMMIPLNPSSFHLYNHNYLNIITRQGSGGKSRLHLALYIDSIKTLELQK